MCDMKFRARPLIVDAIPCFTALQAARTNWGDLPEWFNKLYEDGGIMFLQRTIHVMTVGGWVAAQPEDWIIQGDAGEIFTRSRQTFVDNYEVVEDRE